MRSSPPASERDADREDARRAVPGWRLPRSVRRFGGRLMEQQLWCWGRDVLHPDGNLLMRYGFERRRDRVAADRATCYRLDRDQTHVCLWGFGMFFGRRDLGGLFLDRFEFRPRWAPVESLALAIHGLDELPVFARPRGASQWQRARKLWQSSLLWIAHYERWVRATAGAAYRRECVETWLRPCVRAEHVAAVWRLLGRQVRDRRRRQQLPELQQYALRGGRG